MRHHLLGPSGLRVSQICLGTMTFGERKDWGTDEAGAKAILAAFADAGGSTIDTAPNYAGGAAEEIVGRFVAGARDCFVIGTKYTASPDPAITITGNGRKAMRASVEASLRRLGTDHIDIFWLHYWDATTPLDEILRGLDDLVSQGKILHVGFSDTPAWLTSRAATIADLKGLAPLIAIQAEYNLVARTAERDVLPMAEALGLGVLCWGPLAAGALAAGENPQRRSRSSIPPAISTALDQISCIARSAQMSPMAAALAWLLHNHRWKGLIPIVGARNVAQLDMVLSALNVIPATEMLSELDAVLMLEHGFPHDLITSSYLRKMAAGGNVERLEWPRRPRT